MSCDHRFNIDFHVCAVINVKCYRTTAHNNNIICPEDTITRISILALVSVASRIIAIICRKSRQRGSQKSIKTRDISFLTLVYQKKIKPFPVASMTPPFNYRAPSLISTSARTCTPFSFPFGRLLSEIVLSRDVPDLPRTLLCSLRPLEFILVQN